MNRKQEKRFWSADQKRFVYSLKPPVELVVANLDIHSLANIAPIIQIMILFKSKTLNETVAAVSFYVARNFLLI